MTAAEQAIKDIKDDLKSQSRSFLAFRKKLNPVMDNIVGEYIKHQEHKDK